jgi:tRNA G46 methylase TrmB
MVWKKKRREIRRLFSKDFFRAFPEKNIFFGGTLSREKKSNNKVD